MRNSSALLACAAIAAATTVASVASAGVTSTVKVSTYQDFNAGDAEAAIITSLGEVKAGWSTTKKDLSFEGGVWSALSLDGGRVLIGTSDQGAIYVARGGSVSKLTSIPNVIAVVSMVAGSGDEVFVGTMPEGQVWRVNAATGKKKKLATLKDAETVWSLGRSGGKLYAGVGPKAKLFEIDEKSGNAKEVFEADDKRALSMAVASDGSVWFGTSEKALLYRYDPKRKTTRAMADFAGNEITAVVAYGGGVAAAANELAEPTTSGIKTKQAIDKATSKGDGGEKPKSPSTGTKPGADKSTPSTVAPPRKGGRKGKGSLFYVRGDGSMEQLHALTQTYFTSLAVGSDDQLFAAAADKGRIYMIDKDESVSTAFDVDQRMVSKVMYRQGSGIAFTTDDASALYTSARRASNASYTSKVFDLKAPSRFGRLLWRGSATLKVETRSGNTSEPGKGWSGWTTPRGISRGGGGASGGKVLSPVGRYVQFRVRFNGSSDQVLRSATIYHLPQNRPTKIKNITVAAKEKRSAMSTAASGALKPRSPVLKVSWDVDNPDSDKSVYEIQVRREGEARWRKVATNKPLTGTSYDWNTETFPDGYYRLRVTASDRRANAAPHARTAHKTTELFAVDNVKPRIDSLSVRYPSATARALDAMSPIAEMAYSIDDKRWVVGNTRDGLFDDLTEMLSMSLPKDLRPGLHTLAIRVADEAGNIGSASISFRVK